MRATDHLGGITAFVATAQAGSFTAAAERIGLTQSAIGKSVARLEQRLGVKLFHRSTRHLSLTPEGEDYLVSCQQVLDALQQAEGLLLSQSRLPSGRFRIDLPSAFGRRRIMPLLVKLHDMFPDLHLTVTFTDRYVDLIDEGIDLSIRIGELADSSGLIGRRLTMQNLIFCASPHYLEQFGTPGTVGQIKSHRCVVGYRRDQPISWLLRGEGAEARRITPPATHEFGDGDVLLAATLEGMGIAQLPMWLVSEHIRDGSLIEILHGHAGGQTPITAIWPRSRNLLPKVRALVDLLVEAGERGELD
jgi:DNA-binding transcriptional LysR family regulator